MVRSTTVRRKPNKTNKTKKGGNKGKRFSKTKPYSKKAKSVRMRQRRRRTVSRRKMRGGEDTIDPGLFDYAYKTLELFMDDVGIISNKDRTLLNLIIRQHYTYLKGEYLKEETVIVDEMKKHAKTYGFSDFQTYYDLVTNVSAKKIFFLTHEIARLKVKKYPENLTAEKKKEILDNIETKENELFELRTNFPVNDDPAVDKTALILDIYNINNAKDILRVLNKYKTEHPDAKLQEPGPDRFDTLKTSVTNLGERAFNYGTEAALRIGPAAKKVGSSLSSMSSRLGSSLGNNFNVAMNRFSKNASEKNVNVEQ